MKKSISYVLVLLLSIFIGINYVKAAPSIDSITGDKTSGKTFNVVVKDATGYILSYDGNLVSCSGNSCSTSTNNSSPYGKIVSSADATYTFTINTNNNTKLNFSLIPNDGSTGSVANKEYEINPVTKTSQPAVTTSTTASSVTKSSNANLKSLSIKADDNSDVSFTPNFSSNVYDYSATVASTINKVIITSTAEDSKSNIVLSDNATSALKSGEDNKIVITITAEDGTKKAYNIIIKREALDNNAILTSLSIKENKDFKLKDNVFNYNVKVSSSTSYITISYEPSNASVKVTGNSNLKNGSKVKIVVTAEDGSKKQYVLTIKKTVVAKSTTTGILEERNPIVITVLSVIGFLLMGSIMYLIKNR